MTKECQYGGTFVHIPESCAIVLNPIDTQEEKHRKLNIFISSDRAG